MKHVIMALLVLSVAGCSSTTTVSQDKHQVMDAKISKSAGGYAHCLNQRWSELNPATRYFSMNDTHTVTSYLNGRGETASAQVQLVSDNQASVHIYLTQNAGDESTQLLNAARQCA